MGFVGKFIKYSMFIFNFIFWLCGSIILGVSIYARINNHGQEISSVEEDTIKVHAASNLLIAVGAIIMVLGFLGCCGTVRESRLMLLCFFVGLLLIMILQIAAGVVGIVYKSKFKCCGLVDGAADWGENFNKYASSCECKNDSTTDTNPANVCVAYMGKQVYKETCGDYVMHLLKKNLLIIAGIAFGVAMVEKLGLVFSLYLYRQIGKQ